MTTAKLFLTNYLQYNDLIEDVDENPENLIGTVEGLDVAPYGFDDFWVLKIEDDAVHIRDGVTEMTLEEVDGILQVVYENTNLYPDPGLTHEDLRDSYFHYFPDE